MKVEHLCQVEYWKIKTGACFYSTDGILRIKTDQMGSSGIQSIALSTGIAYSYSDDFMVTPVSARVIVDEH